jgi:hypothetical protein
MSASASLLIKQELSFTSYDTKWIPHSSKLCTIGANIDGTGKLAVYGLADRQLELKQEVQSYQ